MRSKRTNPVLPALSASSKKELLRTIFREICVEQFLENGSEYFASLRFINDTDASPAQNKPWIYTLKQDVDFSADKYCWPIPEDERLKNKLADSFKQVFNYVIYMKIRMVKAICTIIIFLPLSQHAVLKSEPSSRRFTFIMLDIFQQAEADNHDIQF